MEDLRLNPLLYVITDRLDESLPQRVSAALKGGATALQLRCKGASAREVLAMGRSLGPLCKEAGVAFIVNDRLDLALACGADGVHLGPEDLPVDEARRLAPASFIVGASAGTPAEAMKLEALGASYLGVGAIFDARASKSDASPPRGLEALREVCASVRLPVVAIGGIGRQSAPSCLRVGAAGVAVIREVFSPVSPAGIERAAAAMKACLMPFPERR